MFERAREQIAGGIVGAVAAAAAVVGLARGIYTITSAPVVSGENWQQYTMSYLSELPHRTQVWAP